MTERRQVKRKKSSALSWALFIGTFEIVLVSLITVVFPALIVRSVSFQAETSVSAWELGPLAIPLIGTNIAILVAGIIYFKGKFPSKIKNAIDFAFNFEVSKRVAVVVIVVLLGIYAGFTYQETFEPERHGDFPAVERNTENWSIENVLNKNYTPHFRWFYLQSSTILFDNIRIIPFIFSIALLITTYFFTAHLAKKRFAGLIAMTIVLQSSVFLKYDSEATYENGWTLLYLLSLFTMYRLWPLSPISFVLSIFSKQLTVVFLPMTFFFLYKAKIARKKKYIIAIPYLVLAAIGLLAMFTLDTNLMGESVPYSDFDFWVGFTSFAYQLRFDYLVMLLLLPVIAGLFIISRRGISQADPVTFFIGWNLFIAPILTGFTELTNQPYRFIPLVVFLAMGVGLLLYNRGTKATQSDEVLSN